MYRYHLGCLGDRTFLFFYKHCFNLINKMGCKKSGKNVRKIEIPTNRSLSWDIQRRRREREQR